MNAEQFKAETDQQFMEWIQGKREFTKDKEGRTILALKAPLVPLTEKDLIINDLTDKITVCKRALEQCVRLSKLSKMEGFNPSECLDTIQELTQRYLETIK